MHIDDIYISQIYGVKSSNITVQENCFKSSARLHCKSKQYVTSILFPSYGHKRFNSHFIQYFLNEKVHEISIEDTAVDDIAAISSITALFKFSQFKKKYSPHMLRQSESSYLKKNIFYLPQYQLSVITSVY